LFWQCITYWLDWTRITFRRRQISHTWFEHLLKHPFETRHLINLLPFISINTFSVTLILEILLIFFSVIQNFIAINIIVAEVVKSFYSNTGNAIDFIYFESAIFNDDYIAAYITYFDSSLLSLDINDPLSITTDKIICLCPSITLLIPLVPPTYIHSPCCGMKVGLFLFEIFEYS